MLTTTFKLLRTHDACKDRYTVLRKALKGRKDNEPITLIEILDSNGLAVAQFRGVTLGQILYGGDDLSCVEWDERSWQLRAAIREKLFWLCADAVLTV